MSARAMLGVCLGVGLLAAHGCGKKPDPVPEIRSAAVQATGADAAVPAFPEVAAGDWPWWRGPTRDGKNVAEQVPVTWTDTENVAWKAEVPGRGHASPSVRGNRVYLASADEAQQTQMLLAYDRQSGKQVWQTVIHTGNFDSAHQKNTQASSTPAVDAERVYGTFLNGQAIWVTATDLDGHILWQTNAGPFATAHGYAASPALYRALVIIAADSGGKGFLAALHRETGEIVWRVQRSGKISMSSPLVAQVAGRDQLLMSGCDQIVSYDPNTGDVLWQCDSASETTSGTMVAAGDLVFASGGYPGSETICVRADGSGDVGRTHVVWRNSEKFYVPSLVVHEGLLYGVNDNGIAFCFEAETGQEIWKKRLGGGMSASPIVAGGHIYIPNESGETFVLQTGRTFAQVAKNGLDDGGYASPVICGGEIFLRTNHFLYCIREGAGGAR